MTSAMIVDQINTTAGDAYVTAVVDPSGNVTGLVSPSGAVHPLAVRQSASASAFVISDEISSANEIPNCELWLDATSGAMTSTWEQAVEGQAVTTWLDNSGNARHATIAAGSPVYRAVTGFGDNAGVQIGASCRMVTPAFVTAGYGNAITMFIVSKEDAALHSSLKVKASISTANFWVGNIGTTSVRDVTVNGLTGFSGATGAPPALGGIDYLSIGVSAARVQTDGFPSVVAGTMSTDTVAISSGSVPFTNGAVTIGGIAGSAAYDWPGTISEIILYSRALSTIELRQVHRYLSNKWMSKSTIVLLGNSLVSGSGSTGGTAQVQSSAGTNLPSRLVAALGAAARVRTDAFPGRTGASIFSDSPSFSGISNAHDKVISVVWEGTNTLATTSSINKAFDDIRRICLIRSGLSKKVVVGTVLYRGDSGNDTKNRSLTDALNTLIRSRYAEFANGVIDFAADARLSDFNNATYFAADKIHLKDAGYQVCSDLLAPVVTAYL